MSLISCHLVQDIKSHISSDDLFLYLGGLFPGLLSSQVYETDSGLRHALLCFASPEDTQDAMAILQVGYFPTISTGPLLDNPDENDKGAAPMDIDLDSGDSAAAQVRSTWPQALIVSRRMRLCGHEQ